MSRKIKIAIGVPDVPPSGITARPLASIGDESALAPVFTEEHHMPDYRAYIIGSEGHFYTSKVVKADNDEHAVEVAKSLVDGHDAEVWHLDRKIAVLPHKESSEN